MTNIPIPTDVHDPWALAAFVIAILVGWATYRQNRVDKRIGNIEGQVINRSDRTDGPTLRDDFTDRLENISNEMQQVKGMVAGLAHLPAMVEGLASDVRQVKRDQTVDREHLHSLGKPRSNGH